MFLSIFVNRALHALYEPKAPKLIVFPIRLYPPSEIAFRFHGVNIASPLMCVFEGKNVA